MPVAEPTLNVNSKGRFNKHTLITILSRKPLFSYHLNRMAQYHLLHLQYRVKYSLTLVLLNISTLMAFNPKLVKIQSSTRICVGVGLITIYLHRSY